MGIDNNTSKEIQEFLFSIVKDKLDSYAPETDHKPFHHRLIGKKLYTIFSLVQSLNTTFGMSVWEQIAVILARNSGNIAERQYNLLGSIDNKTENLINKLHLELMEKKKKPDKKQETDMIRKSIVKAVPAKDSDSTVDLFVKIGNQENYIDITTVKPNKKEFRILKKKLLRWTALRLSTERETDVMTRLAMPYNPYYPDPYERWTAENLYDSSVGEILVGPDFWNTIAQKKVYDDLLNIFEKTGEQLKRIIDDKFSRL